MAKLAIFIDGACEPRNPGGVPTYGFVIYSDGRRIAEGSGLAADPWSVQASNNVAEYTALIRALERLQTLGLEGSEVEVRSDSRLLVQQFKGDFKVRAARLKPLHDKVEELRQHFNVQMKWIPREENAEADALTRQAYALYMQANPQTAEGVTPHVPHNGTMFCFHCGAQIPRQSRFCKECGTKLV